MARGIAHEEGLKAQVLADLALGETVSAVARKHGLSRSVVTRWRDDCEPSELVSVQQEKRDELGELVAEYVRANLAALTAQTRQFADPTWLRQQNAADLAVLHGVQFDKLARLLEAIRPPADAAGAAAAAP
ncbi:MAG TPA: helix-turn-helix domain-containing protein [Rhodothermales bacterium]|nr:helix-turn-helix domain-containing protein [Rhodothermales bacterium]